MFGLYEKIFLKLFRGIRHPIKSYKNSLEKHPVLVQSVQNGIVYGCSDLIAQFYVERTPASKINVKRTIVFITTGAIYAGPAGALWYRFLAKKIGTTGNLTVVKKVAVDQLLYVPIFHLGLITVVNTLHGNNVEFIIKQIRQKYIDILSTSIKIWPIVNLINFKFTPLRYQLLIVQIVGLFWNTFVSWKIQ